MADDPRDNVVRLSSEPSEPVPIAKPDEEFNLDKFRSSGNPTIANVETLVTALPILTISQAKDFVRLHSDDKSYWSTEYCFVSVPIKGVKGESLHLIVRGLAERYLDSRKILKFRLALATKPYDVFFLCRVPSVNLDNTWNLSNLQACEQAKRFWVQVLSRKEEGVDGYKTTFSRDVDAFPGPNWPKQSLNELIAKSFFGRTIEDDKHPGLARLIGAKQDIS
jgi:hypothetical protein